jgi:hypothetical protein
MAAAPKSSILPKSTLFAEVAAGGELPPSPREFGQAGLSREIADYPHRQIEPKIRQERLNALALCVGILLPGLIACGARAAQVFL